MPTAKATVEKTASKTAKKIRLDDLLANCDRIQRSHEEFEKAHKETTI